ncbi:MAG: InlB B-repeat-containing protein, partial [Alistipes sp.]|nr:InlB B-repeat-containing protein [Alistipes sp.]
MPLGFRYLCTVTFDANGGTLPGEATIVVAGGETVPEYHYAQPPEGCTFTGWYRDAAATAPWDMYADVVTGNMTLYAGFKARHAVTYHFNGGGFRTESNREPLTISSLDGDLLSVPDNVAKPGYVLEGWFRDKELTDRWNFSADVTTGDTDLYAGWGAGIEDLTLENYPRVDGATSTRALNNMIACKLLGVDYAWVSVSDTSELNVYALDDGGQIDEAIFGGRIATSQTYGAMMNLIEGKADIILRSTTASPDERAAAEAAGVTLVETPIALDAFVFLKNRANPVRSLTLDEIRKIYTGRITDWSQVGGRQAAITPYSRPRNSGSEEAFRELVMKDADPVEFPEEQLIRNNEPWSMALLMWELAQNRNGIGYIFKNYKEMIMRRYEPVFAIDGIAPT